LRAGANRVVNPQSIGGARMAAFVLQPAVAEFLDVVMHDGSLDFRLEEVRVPEGSRLVGATIRDAQVRDRTGALVLAIRGTDGEFVTNPEPDAKLAGGQLLIAIGTAAQLEALSSMVGGAAG
jgi:voltage-gated potassium channel